jgi:predicted RNase H-like HicB family nuclease
MKFLVTLERDEDGFVVVGCSSLPGCLSQGRTEVEALANIREAIEASLETRRQYGLATQVEVAEVEIETSTG